ncbi:MAG TPA: heat-inducible transcriptional repressor HrcA [Acidimicrobiales bacterium]|nr:heat-inducible transcriptional repressor HrcA [Acidimicrobiales bacterium]
MAGPLDERKAAVLRAVVEEYIETAQPVGSSHVVRNAGVNVSAATIRNDMAALERDGYLMHPHTSAGRVPTDLGYRFFVDSLAPSENLGRPEQQRVRDFFARTHGALEEMLADTSHLLAHLTNYAAVVIGGAPEQASVRSVQIVDVGSHTGMAVVVLSNQAIHKAVFDLPEDAGEETLAAAGRAMSAVMVGSGEFDASVPATGDAAVDSVVKCAGAALAARANGDGDHVFVGGAARVADAFDAVDTVRRVLGVLEHQYVVVGLLRDVLDRGQSVAIGTEHGLAPLAECAVVVAPFSVAGEPAGTVGVLGPTRMNYPHALAAVTAVSKRLGESLSES